MSTITTTIDEIATGVFRISTYTPEGPPGGLTFNQFVVVDEQPMLVHTGMRVHFDQTRAAIETALPPDRLRWITSNHASRPDELGSLDQWFAVAPSAEVVHGQVACFVNLPDVTERAVRPMVDGETIDLGRHRLRWMATPHVPGPWEAGFWFDETERLLFCGDVFSQAGKAPATTAGDIVEAAVAHDVSLHGYAVTPATAPTLRRLADLEPTTLALMHGPTFRGDGGGPLRALADHFDRRLRSALGEPAAGVGASP